MMTSSPRRSASPQKRETHEEIQLEEPLKDESMRDERSPSPRRRSPESKREDRSDAPPSEDDQPNPGNNLFVTGLTMRCEDVDLKTHFGKFGNLIKASVMRDPHTNDSRGFGFVTFESVEDAEKALNELTGTEFMGRTLTVQKAKRASARNPTPGRYYGPAKRRPRHDPYERPPRGDFYRADYDRRPPPNDYRRDPYDRPRNIDRYVPDRRDPYSERDRFERFDRRDDRRFEDERRPRYEDDRRFRYEDDRRPRYEDRRY